MIELKEKNKKKTMSMSLSKDGWIGSIGVININKQPVKRTDAKIMNTLYFMLSHFTVALSAL